MRRVRHRKTPRCRAHDGDQAIQCLPTAVMRARAFRVGFARELALSDWPAPVTFIRLIAMLLLGIVSAQAVAVDAHRSEEPPSMRSIRGLGTQFVMPANRLSGTQPSLHRHQKRPKMSDAPSQITAEIPGPRPRIDPAWMPVRT